MARKCPACRQLLGSESRNCGKCGAELYAACPSCGRMTFIQSNCRYCRASLYVKCAKQNCGHTQLISPDGKCRFCGCNIDNRA